MGTKRHKPEEIVAKLRQVEVLVGQGMARVDALNQGQKNIGNVSHQHSTSSSETHKDASRSVHTALTLKSESLALEGFCWPEKSLDLYAA